jgi:hypothetical protein
LMPPGLIQIGKFILVACFCAHVFFA